MSKQPKESFFSKKSKKDSEKRDADQQKISKMIAAYHKKWGEPTEEEETANENGIEIGKRSVELNIEDKIREAVDAKAAEMDKLIDTMAKSLEKTMEDEVNERVKAFTEKGANKPSLKEQASNLSDNAEKVGMVGLSVFIETNKFICEGVVAGTGKTEEIAKALRLAAKVSPDIKAALTRAFEDMKCKNCGKIH